MQTKRTTYYRFPAAQIKSLVYNEDTNETVVTLKGQQWGEKHVVESLVQMKVKDIPRDERPV